jgi:hypothetical protein
MFEEIEKKIMKMMSEKLVARKSELIEHVKRGIKGNPHSPKSVVDSVTKELVQKGYIIPLYASETTFAITQKGIREVK